MLQTAHLNRDPEQTTDDQLMAMCARCHFAYDRLDNQTKRSYGRLYKRDQLLIPFGEKKNGPLPGEGGL